MKKIISIIIIILIGIISIYADSDRIEKVFNYPNPYNPLLGTETTIVIKYVNNSGISSLSYYLFIYNLLGDKVLVRKLTSTVNTGTNTIKETWSGKNDEGKLVSPGLYYIKIITDTGAVSSTNSVSIQTDAAFGKMLIKY